MLDYIDSWFSFITYSFYIFYLQDPTPYCFPSLPFPSLPSPPHLTHLPIYQICIIFVSYANTDIQKPIVYKNVHVLYTFCQQDKNLYEYQVII